MAKIGEPSTFQDLINLIKSKLGTAAYKDTPSSGNASTTEVVLGSDTRLTDTRDPKSHSHTVSDISDFPTLGTAAALNVATSGNASTSEVVKGDDTRLTDSRTPTSHTHTTSDISDFPTLGTAAALNVATSGNASTTEVVKGDDTRLTDSRTPTSHTHLTVDITDLSFSAYQTKTLSSPITVDGVEVTQVESALSAINNKPSGGGSYYEDFVAITSTGISTFYGKNIWTDGENIYHSNAAYQYELTAADENSLTWTEKTWTGDYTSIVGENIWTDGTNIYYTTSTATYVLDKENSSWSTKTFTNTPSNFRCSHIWTDGENIYHSNAGSNYIYDKENSEWISKTWTGLTNFDGQYVWTDGINIYFSNNSTNYKLDKTNSSWSVVSFTGITSFYGNYVWMEGDDVYYSSGASKQYKLVNKETRTWEFIDRLSSTIVTIYNGYDVWHDLNGNAYYSGGSTNYIYKPTSVEKYIGLANGIATLDNNRRIRLYQTNYVQVGVNSNTTPGTGATIEGTNNSGTGNYAHTEGSNNGNTGGNNCHVEGVYNTVENSPHAHVENGYNNVSNSKYAHVEGERNVVTNQRTHVEGYYNITGNENQHVQGKFNVGKSTTAFEIGNGTATNARSNAMEVDWSGNATFAGDVIATVNNSTISLSAAQLSTLSSAITIGGTSQTTVEDALTALNAAKAESTHTHTVSDISDFPTLGTAAALNVATSGNASTTEVVKGDDTRLTDSRTPTSHTHTVSDISDFPTLGTAATKNITISTTDLTPGTSALNTGDIYIVYEA